MKKNLIFLLLLFPALAYAFEKHFVDALTLDPTLHIQMMYASSENFLGRVVAGYKENKCELTLEAALALKNAQDRLKKEGLKQGKQFRLKLFDCYRSQVAVDDFMNWVQDEQDQKTKVFYYPNVEKKNLVTLGYIAKSSGHSLGNTIDLSIEEMTKEGTWKELNMGTRVDYFDEASHTFYQHLSEEEKKNRALLLKVMQPEFKNYSKEWWHYSLVKSKK